MAMAQRNAARDRLIEIVRQRSFSKGQDVTLVSGRSSNFYFNMKPSMLDPEGGALIAGLILDALKGADVDLIGGLEMGAVPLAVAVTSQIKGWPLRAFFVRKEVKDHGARKLVEGLAPDESLAGKRIVVLEDVTTTGASALRAIEAVRADGAVVVCVISVVDRQEGAERAFRAAGVPFTALLTAADFL